MCCVAMPVFFFCCSSSSAYQTILRYFFFRALSVSALHFSAIMIMMTFFLQPFGMERISLLLNWQFISCWCDFVTFRYVAGRATRALVFRLTHTRRNGMIDGDIVIARMARVGGGCGWPRVRVWAPRKSPVQFKGGCLAKISIPSRNVTLGAECWGTCAKERMGLQALLLSTIIIIILYTFCYGCTTFNHRKNLSHSARHRTAPHHVILAEGDEDDKIFHFHFITLW